MIGVAQAFRQFGLQVEGQPFLGPAGEIMQVTAHRAQEILGLGEQTVFA